ncbi:WD40-repeat-containing domain protein [Rhodocollybia butyracea]|uniref:WD40-repeat-containing domain protein n=1 Tax=Rhodocollybia butyracea TaxID=206335 RepID=A0A9P5UD21_9AGAR|nr:WD40-repeat-containing domain protein [Rhodocollybia butyracea]
MTDATTSVAVHRCRFIDFDPSAITAVAFPPLPLPYTKPPKTQYPEFGVLAVGHANGNIDLCEWTGLKNEFQSPQAWVIRKTLPGLYPSKVDSLAFIIREPHTLKEDQVPTVSDLRLFSSGGGSELLEWDMEGSCVRRTINSQGGTIWSVAANPAGTLLALGCEDGTVRLLSVADDTLQHHKRFDRVKCRILSVAWGPPILKENSAEDDDEDDEWNDEWIVTGCSDSSLRKWDAVTGRMLDRMGTDKIRGERTLVWTVATLGDGTIVSGDSLGMVKLWDSRTATQLQSFQAHGADVLCLTVGPDGLAVYSSGVDQKLIQFSLIKTNKAATKNSTEVRTTARWVQTSSRRMHSHDVRSLAIWPPYTPLPSSHKRQFPSEIAPIIASGGLDMSVVVTPAALPASTMSAKVINPLATSVHATFEDSYHRRLAYSSGPSSTSAISIARQARLVSCMQDSRVSIWRILKKPLSPSLTEDETPEEPDNTSAQWEKCVEMELDVHTNLVASAISDDGKWIVVSDLYETKLFRLVSDAEGRLKPRRIRSISEILSPHLPQKPASTGDPRVLRKFDHHRQRNTLSRNRVTKDLKVNGDVEMSTADEENAEDSESSDEDDDSPLLGSVSRIAISADGQWLATTDDRCRTHVFNLDSIQHHCVLPSFQHPAQSLAFDPANPNLLILAFPNNTFQVYDVETRQFPAWSHELCNNLPKRFTTLHDPIIGVTFEPPPAGAPSQSSGKFAVFWGSSWLCKMGFEDGPFRERFSKKRRRESTKPPPSYKNNNDGGPDEPHYKEFKMITHYRPLLFVDYLAHGELIVVERPLVDVLATLPPAYFKHKYGAS